MTKSSKPKKRIPGSKKDFNPDPESWICTSCEVNQRDSGGTVQLVRVGTEDRDVPVCAACTHVGFCPQSENSGNMLMIATIVKAMRYFLR